VTEAPASALRRAGELARFAARRATAWARLRPTFLVIGAQRSGTTSLNDYLAEHPAVLSAAVKEVQYFHRYYEKGDRWYRSRFPLAVRAAVVRRRTGVIPAVGEASPDYLFDPRVPARVHAFDPRMKLIVVLRDPVDRAYSQWRMVTRHGHESLLFEDALDREEAELEGELERLLETDGYRDVPFRTSYVARGRYAEQLERWLALFPREQLLVLLTDELSTDPEGAMSRVARFLGIPEWHAESYRLRGVQGEAAMAPETRERLARTFEPHNRRLEELLGRELPWTSPATTEAPR
jgi:hypothetical protein